MSLSKLDLTPTVEGYGTERPDGETRSVALDGGLSLQQAYMDGGAVTVSVQFICTSDDESYLNAFYRTTINSGTDQFLIDLAIEGYGLIECTAQFVSGTLRMTKRDGDLAFYSAVLEAIPPDTDADFDEAIISWPETMPDYPLSQFLLDLEEVIKAMPPA